MAASLPEVIEEEFLCCRLCFRTYYEPKLLPCLHSFCRSCLERHVSEKGKDGQFNCPICESLFLVPEHGIRSFLPNMFITSLQEMELSQSGGSKKCNNCETGDARFRCLDCRHHLCGGCRDAHNWLKITRGHKVMTLNEVQSGRYHRGDLYQRHAAATCYVHSKQNLSHQCLQCDVAICNECLSTCHTSHRIGDLHSCAERDRCLIEHLCRSVKEQEKMFKSAQDKLSAYKKQCESEQLAILKAFQKQKDELHQLIDECHQTLITQVEDYYKDEMENQQSRDELIQRTLNIMDHQTNLTKKMLKHGKDADIMTLGRLLKINLNHHSFATPPELDSKLSVNFQPATLSPGLFVPMFGRLSKRRSDVKQTNKNQSPMMQERMNHVKFKPRLLHEFRGRTQFDLKGCKPTSIVINDDDEIIAVDDINKKIKIFDKNGEILREICPVGDHELLDPWDVTIMVDGNLAVTDRAARDVKIFTPTGEFVKKFSDNMKSPWGITTNSRGEIIVTDPAARAVLVHDQDGNYLHPLIGKDQTNLFFCPEYVTCNANDDIIISDFDKHCLTVFDSQGRFMFLYGTRGSGLHQFNVPCGVTTDRFGNIIVADYTNQRIHMLSMNGRFQSFLLTRDDNLEAPQSVAMNSDGHLVVVDGINIKTFLFPSTNDLQNIESSNFFNLVYDNVVLKDEQGLLETDI